MASEPRYISPALWPIASGDPLRGANHQIVFAGKDESQAQTHRASAATPRCTASTGSRPFFISSVTRCATTSVSVSRAEGCALLRAQFSRRLAEILDDTVMH